MTDEERPNGIEFIGVQQFDVCALALFNDPVTGSTFALVPGETVSDGLARVRARFGEIPTHAPREQPDARPVGG